MSVDVYADLNKYDFVYKNIVDFDYTTRESIKYIQDELKKDPKNYNFYFLLGYLYNINSQNMKKAEDAYLKTIELKPNHYLAYLNLGYLYFEDDESMLNKAITYFEKAYRYNKDNPVVYNALAASYSKLGKTDKAKNIFEEGIRKIKNDDSIYYNASLLLMYFYQGTDEINAVETYLKKAISLSPKKDYYFLLGIFYLQNKKHNKAQHELENAYLLDTTDINTIFVLSKSYIETKNYKKAMDFLNKALEIDPHNQEAIDTKKEIEKRSIPDEK